MLVVDTSAWIDHFEGYAEVSGILEKEVLLTPAIALAEITRFLKRTGKTDERVQEVVSIIKRRSTILPLDEQNAAMAGVVSFNNHFDFVDGVIYSYASKEHKAFSTDRDFKAKPFAIFVEIKKKK